MSTDLRMLLDGDVDAGGVAGDGAIVEHSSVCSATSPIRHITHQHTIKICTIIGSSSLRPGSIALQCAVVKCASRSAAAAIVVGRITAQLAVVKNGATGSAPLAIHRPIAGQYAIIKSAGAGSTTVVIV